MWSDATREYRENPRRFRMHPDGALAAADMPRGGRRPVVLIVDDDEAMRSLVACVVEAIGYRTIVSADAHKALDLAGSEYVDVILTDALMPKMDGRELCRLIKDWHGPKKKVIIMTSLYRQRKFRAEAMDTFGADEFLTKPLDFDRLGNILQQLAPLPVGVAVAACAI